MFARMVGEKPQFQIGGKKIGHGHPTYIIAEMSCNHHQQWEKAEELIRAAADCGVDCLKLQTYTADSMTLDSDKEYFRLGGGTLWDGMYLHKLYRKASTPWEWHGKIKKLSEELGMHCFSSPFSAEAVDFLASLDVPAYKIASFETSDHPLLKKVAQTGKPVIMSTGTCTLSEIDEAIRVLRDNGCKELAVLKCSSAYPSNPAEMNLSSIPNLSDIFGVVTGLSDHTEGITIPLLSVALGGCIIEKHFIMARSEGGPDSKFSLEPAEFKEMVRTVRLAELALGRVHYGPTTDEKKSLILRRSIFVCKPVKKGETFTEENIRCIRPAHGLKTSNFEYVLGRKATMDIEFATPLAWQMVGFNEQEEAEKAKASS